MFLRQLWAHRLAGAVFFCVCGVVLVGAASAVAGVSFIGPLNTIGTVASTVPANGDLNPYGVAVAPTTAGRLVKGDVLVSNFNNSAISGNLQGTGTTIVEVSPSGGVTLFATLDASTLPGACPGGVGLTTALVALRSGWVIVGSLPTSNGMSPTAQAGCLIVLNNQGQPGGDDLGSADQRALGYDRVR